MTTIDKKIIKNSIITPDGTELISRSVWDYVEHLDTKTNFKYAVDGGNYYIRRVCEKDDYQETSVFSDDPFELIRLHYCRGTLDHKNKKRLWIPLYLMSTDHLYACLIYNKEIIKVKEPSFANQMYREELKFRREHNIYIADYDYTDEELRSKYDIFSKNIGK